MLSPGATNLVMAVTPLALACTSFFAQAVSAVLGACLQHPGACQRPPYLCLPPTSTRWDCRGTLSVRVCSSSLGLPASSLPMNRYHSRCWISKAARGNSVRWQLTHARVGL